jgi:hypothetical protein
VGDGDFQVASEVEDVEVAVVVDGGEETGVVGVPVHVVDVVFRVLEGAQGLLGVGVPQLHRPVVGTGEDQSVEEFELGGAVDGDSADGPVVLVEHGDLLVALVVQGVLVEHAVEGADVVVVGVASGELAAGDVDVVHLLLVGAVEDGGGVGDERAVGAQRAVGGQRGVERALGLRALGAAGAELVHARGLAELLDVPDAHHPVVGVGHDVVGDLRPHHVQRAHRVLVRVRRYPRPLHRHRLRPDVPQQDLPVVAPAQHRRVGEGVELGRSDCRLPEAVELRPVLESGVPEQDQAHVVLYAAFLVLTVRGQEELVYLGRPVEVSDHPVGSVVGVGEGDSLSQDVVSRSI